MVKVYNKRNILNNKLLVAGYIILTCLMIMVTVLIDYSKV